MTRLRATLTLLIIMSAPVFGTTIHIPADFPTIQEGINACDPGDTVLVSPGTYYEHLVIDKEITLSGMDRDTTWIDGSSTGDVMLITADGVQVNNFTIQRCGSDMEDAGIEIAFSDQCTVDTCKIVGNYKGLSLYGSSHNTITDCWFVSNSFGIEFREDMSASTPDNYKNRILNNLIDSNSESGILFEHTLATYHHSTTITGNTIIQNQTGISMIMSMTNEISFNNISNNTGYGIALSMCMGGGDGNLIHHNNFVDNKGGSVQGSDFGGGIDTWYLAGNNEGNYWSDYTGPDADHNGIGDIPYDIDGMESQDLYPLMDPVATTIPVTNMTCLCLILFLIPLLEFRRDHQPVNEAAR